MAWSVIMWLFLITWQAMDPIFGDVADDMALLAWRFLTCRGDVIFMGGTMG